MLRCLTIAALITLTGAWLFGDTYAKYWGPSQPPNVLRFAHFGAYEDFEFWKQVIADFELAHPKLHVRQEYVVGPGGHYHTKMRQQALVGRLPDIALVQLAPFHELADHFADLGEWVANETLDDSARTAFRAGGTQRGLPVSGGNLMVYVNRACVRAAERHSGQPLPLPLPDWTLAEFREFARRMTIDFDADGRTDQFGFWMPTWVYFQPFLWSCGAALADDANRRWTLCGDAAEQALGFYGDLLREGVCPREEDVPQVFQDVGFLTGRVAMCVSGPWLMPFLEKTSLRGDYDVFPILGGPGGRSTRMTWDGVVIPKELPADRRRAAELFVAYQLSEPVQKKIAQTGRALPALRSAQIAFTEHPLAAQRAAFVQGLADAQVQPLYPNFGDVDAVVNELLYRLTSNPDADVTLELQRVAADPRIRRAFPEPSDCTP